MPLPKPSSKMRTAVKLAILVTLSIGLALEIRSLLRRPVDPQLIKEVGRLNAGGQFLYFERRYEQAAMEFTKAVELVPGYSPAWVNLGFTRLELGDLEGARQSFEMALSLDQGLGMAQRGLGMYFIQKHQPEFAMIHLERALEHPLPADGAEDQARAAYEQSQVLLWMAEAQRLEGDLPSALGRAEEAAHLAPNDPMVGLVLGRTLWAAGRRREAIEAIESGLASGRHLLLYFRDPQTGKEQKTSTYLARLYMEMGDYASAQKHLTYSIQDSQGEQLKEAHLLLAECLTRLGDPARASFHRALATLVGTTAEPPSPAPTLRPGEAVPAPPSSIASAPAGRLPARAEIRFRDVTQAAGLGGWRHNCGPTLLYNPEVTPPGCAMLDVDGDGYLDLFVPTGSDAYFDGRLVRTNSNALWRNTGHGTFEDVAALAGLAGHEFGQGCVVADFDNDGYPDLYVTCFGPSHLYRNNGDGTFTDVTKAAGVLGGQYSTAAAFGDFDRDGFLDLFVGHYTQMDYTNPPHIDRLAVLDGDYLSPTTIGPYGMPGLPNILYRANGDGTFRDVTSEALHIGKTMVGNDTLGAIWTDINGDGWPDLLVANDGRSVCLYENQRDGTFRDVASRRWLADLRGNMGVDVADYDNDGLLDIVITHWVREETALYRGSDRIGFTDVALEAGVVKTTSATTGWGVGFCDFDNDGFADIFIANGLTCAQHYDPANYPHVKNFLAGQSSQVYQNQRDGHFVDVSAAAGLTSMVPRVGRGAAFGDIDNDGGMDVLVANNNGPVYLLTNATADRGHWLEVELVGTESNREAVGARVSIVVGSLHELRETHAGSSYMSSNSPWVHFGLGSHTTVDHMEVLWPRGARTAYGPIRADRRIRLTEPWARPESRRD